MISLNEAQPSRPGEVPALYLSVALEGTEPRVWRRILVPATAKLGTLHAVLQVAMGWTNSHLHDFRFKDTTYSDPSFNLDAPSILDERKCSLAKLLVEPGDFLHYEYDFGDSWSHFVLLSEVSTTPFRSARCIEGVGACPPEDCGGIPGFMELLKAVKKPKSKAAKEYEQWLGYPYDPNAFSCDDVNPWLGRLPWPTVSTSALSKVIVARMKHSKGRQVEQTEE